MAIAIIQIILSVLIITLILLQERSSGMSGLMGGSGEGYYQARRGMEKLIFYSTIVLSVLFVALAVYQLFAQTH
ncbi:MAG TPA: preprotein translocase subunit SecG [Candidatus Paceibacterota bacterium]|nr:preprotein translocase subunit SecG [Candidatus Paceibacterota bacterium]